MGSVGMLAAVAWTHVLRRLGFVRTCFPWGEAGTALEHFPGPDEWQCQELREIGRQVQERAFGGHTPVSPIRRGVASGHGIGKSALTAGSCSG